MRPPVQPTVWWSPRAVPSGARSRTRLLTKGSPDASRFRVVVGSFRGALQAELAEVEPDRRIRGTTLTLTGSGSSPAGRSRGQARSVRRRRRAQEPRDDPRPLERRHHHVTDADPIAFVTTGSVTGSGNTLGKVSGEFTADLIEAAPMPGPGVAVRNGVFAVRETQ